MGEGKQTHCQYCDEPMDPGSEFIFWVESQNYDEQVAPLEMVQLSPLYHGEPLRICKECRDSIEQNRLHPPEQAARMQHISKLYMWALAILFVSVVLCILYEFIAYQMK